MTAASGQSTANAAFASRSRVTSRADQRLLSLVERQGLSSDGVNALVHRWIAEHNDNEPLANYLVRLGILRTAAPQILAMNWGDNLLRAGSDDLFERDGLTLLWQLIGAGRSATKQSNLPTAQTHPNANHSCPRPAATTELSQGQVLGRCVIVGRLAHGSYGTVYRALHRTLNVPVAVKVLHTGLLKNKSPAAEQFRSEALMLAKLNHPNIVRVWDFDDTVSPPYIVLEFVEGMNIAEMIHRRGSVRLDLAVKVVLQVIDGLEAANQHGIVHQDIKPANVLLTRDENAKIADLGLAVVIDRERAMGRAAGGTTSAMAGTVAYLAPEQAGAPGVVDHRADIYSLGASFYHMVTGQLPFQGKSPLVVLMKHAKEPVVPPCQIVPDFDRGLSDVIVRMLAKNPADRFRNYDELRDALIDADIEMSSTSGGLAG